MQFPGSCDSNYKTVQVELIRSVGTKFDHKTQISSPWQVGNRNHDNVRRKHQFFYLKNARIRGRLFQFNKPNTQVRSTWTENVLVSVSVSVSFCIFECLPHPSVVEERSWASLAEASPRPEPVSAAHPAAPQKTTKHRNSYPVPGRSRSARDPTWTGAKKPKSKQYIGY